MVNNLRNLKRLVKKVLSNFSLCLRYMVHSIYVACEIRNYKTLKKKAPVLLCIANPGSIGGTELQIQIIAEALKTRLGDCIVLISGKLEGGRSNLFVERLKSLGIPFLRLKSVGIVNYDQWPFLKKTTAYLLKKVIKDSKICHFFNPTSTVLAPVMKSIGLDVYYMETGMPVAEGWWKILHTTMGHFKYVTSVSLAGLRRLESLYGYKGPSCVTPSMFNPLPSQFLCRKPVEGVFDIVYFGRMTRGKGVDLLIQAFSRLVRDYPYARLSLIGSGERLPLLRELVNELHLSDRVQFTGWLQGEALFSRLITHDLCCLPSFSEGLPSSILEAMSIGLPVVATDVGGVSEIIEHNVSGILIPPRDQEALTKTLLELAGDPQRCVQLREEALLRWKKVGTKEVILNQLMAAYRMAST
jgi:glycosyltransferase involved in cell wall biosynthesis